jgi:hypothetical protein
MNRREVSEITMGTAASSAPNKKSRLPVRVLQTTLQDDKSAKTNLRNKGPQLQYENILLFAKI